MTVLMAESVTLHIAGRRSKLQPHCRVEVLFVFEDTL